MFITNHSISPSKVVRGEGAWKESLDILTNLCQRPLIIGRSEVTKKIRTSFKKDLLLKGIRSISLELDHDCCELDIQKAYRISIKNNCDGRVVSILEGGYDLNALVESTEQHINALLEFN